MSETKLTKIQVLELWIKDHSKVCDLIDKDGKSTCDEVKTIKSIIRFLK